MAGRLKEKLKKKFKKLKAELKEFKERASRKIKIDMYINLVDEDDDSEQPKYVGSFVNVPHMGMKMGEGRKRMMTILR